MTEIGTYINIYGIIYRIIYTGHSVALSTVEVYKPILPKFSVPSNFCELKFS